MKKESRKTYLKTDEIRTTPHHLLQDQLLPVIPSQRPPRRVRIRRSRSVPLAENVVAQDRERLWCRLWRESVVGFDSGPFSVGRRKRDGARVSKVGDEGLGSVLLEDEPERLWERVSCDSKDVELVEGSELGRKIRDLVVEEEELLEGGDHSELWRDRTKLISGSVEDCEFPEEGDGCWEGREGVVVDVEGGDVGEGEEGRREGFEMDSSEVETAPRLLVGSIGADDDWGGESGGMTES